MKTEKNILMAFFLNLFFSLFEFAGGIFSGSFAILSDAVHDVGDAAAIGLSYFLERKSKSEPDDSHSYGYVRYSVAGGFITSLILLAGSLTVIIGAIEKILEPGKINVEGMMIFALVGTAVNLAAAFVTKGGSTVNERAVNLHMLEDVLGWVSVLIGAFVIKATGFVFIDPLLSVAISVFIIIGALKNLRQVADIFLEKTPEGISCEEIRQRLKEIGGVEEIHHIHIRSLDGYRSYCTMHIVLQGDPSQIKKRVRQELKRYNIVHCTLETETPEENCGEKVCTIEKAEHHHHHH